MVSTQHIRAENFRRIKAFNTRYPQAVSGYFQLQLGMVLLPDLVS
jgi:hypothetical protein